MTVDKNNNRQTVLNDLILFGQVYQKTTVKKIILNYFEKALVKLVIENKREKRVQEKVC